METCNGTVDECKAKPQNASDSCESGFCFVSI